MKIKKREIIINTETLLNVHLGEIKNYIRQKNSIYININNNLNSYIINNINENYIKKYENIQFI